jgi:hypothetical protein
MELEQSEQSLTSVEKNAYPFTPVSFCSVRLDVLKNCKVNIARTPVRQAMTNLTSGLGYRVLYSGSYFLLQGKAGIRHQTVVGAAGGTKLRGRKADAKSSHRERGSVER